MTDGPTIDAAMLCRQWVRSRADDTATEQVYRPAGYPLPPSRGRAGMTFREDGTFVESAIGATDVNRVSQGRWQLADPTTGKLHIDVGGRSQVLTVISVTPDRLAIAPEKP